MQIGERKSLVFAIENEKICEVVLQVEAFEERHHMVNGGRKHLDLIG